MRKFEVIFLVFYFFITDNYNTDAVYRIRSAVIGLCYLQQQNSNNSTQS
jgi:hypothetical protein